jgi:Putative translation factor (SUA5)
MAKIIEIHPQNPQNRLVRQVIDELHKGAVIAYPTDSGYALGAALGNKNGLERIRKNSSFI